jgi:hypothetical protein
MSLALGVLALHDDTRGNSARAKEEESKESSFYISAASIVFSIVLLLQLPTLRRRRVLRELCLNSCMHAAERTAGHI